MIEITSIEVLEEDVRRRRREAKIIDRGRIAYDGRGPDDLRPNNGRGPDGNGNNGRGPDETGENGNNGRGPDENGNNGRGPDGNGNNGRGPDDSGNNGRGPDDNTDDGRGYGDDGYDGPYPDDAGSGTRGGQEQPNTSREPQTVEYFVISGDMSYHVVADVILVDRSGREVAGFTVESHQAGPFERGEYDGNWDRLDLTDDEMDLFNPRALLAQKGPIEAAVMEELAVAIAGGTFDMILSRVP